MLLKKEKLDRKNHYNHVLQLDTTSVWVSKHNSSESYKHKQDILQLMQVWFSQHLNPTDLGNIYFPYIHLLK